jgi:hypothetical protein
MLGDFRMEAEVLQAVQADPASPFRTAGGRPRAIDTLVLDTTFCDADARRLPPRVRLPSLTHTHSGHK